jgi:hypothetical protein
MEREQFGQFRFGLKEPLWLLMDHCLALALTGQIIFCFI